MRLAGQCPKSPGAGPGGLRAGGSMQGPRGAHYGSQGSPGRLAALRGQPRAEIRPLTSRAQQQLQRFQNALQTAGTQSLTARCLSGGRHDWSGTRHWRPAQAPERTAMAAILDVAEARGAGPAARGGALGRGRCCRMGLLQIVSQAPFYSPGGKKTANTTCLHAQFQKFNMIKHQMKNGEDSS